MALVAPAGHRQPQKLRVGLFADAPLQPRWAVEAFARIAASDFAAIAAIAVAAGAPAPLPWPVAAYRRLDGRAFGGEPSQALALERHVAHERLLEAPGAAELAALELDVAFVLGECGTLALARAARYGMWRFCFGVDGADPAAMAGFGEVARGEPLTRSGLEIVLPGEPPRLACESWSRTFPHSVARNRAQLLPRTAELAYRALREVHRSGRAWIERCPAPEKPPARTLAPRAALADVGRIGARVLKRACLRALCVEQWFLAFRFGATAQPGVPADLAGFTRILPPRDRDWADPFAVERGGRHWVFFEERPFATGRGHIAMVEIDALGRWSAPVRVLSRDYHLSYPFLFEHEGALYMIPESGESRTVELYRCTDFPLRWRLERVLLDGVRCADATLHRAADRWWMFATVAPGESPSFDDELHLYHAERLDGAWKPHPANPVSCDPRSARPAGKLFVHGGALYRPAQICVPRYGAGITLQRVHRLTAAEYLERPVQRIVPPEAQGLLGLHTLNRAGALMVVDAFMRRPRI